MSLEIKPVGSIEKAKLFFDPLRKNDSFLILRENDVKSGFIMDEEIILESNANIKWDEVTGIIGGFSDIIIFKKIQDKINKEDK